MGGTGGLDGATTGDTRKRVNTGFLISWNPSSELNAVGFVSDLHLKGNDFFSPLEVENVKNASQLAGSRSLSRRCIFQMCVFVPSAETAPLHLRPVCAF